MRKIYILLLFLIITNLILASDKIVERDEFSVYLSQIDDIGLVYVVSIDKNLNFTEKTFAQCQWRNSIRGSSNADITYALKKNQVNYVIFIVYNLQWSGFFGGSSAWNLKFYKNNSIIWSDYKDNKFNDRSKGMRVFKAFRITFNGTRTNIVDNSDFTEEEKEMIFELKYMFSSKFSKLPDASQTFDMSAGILNYIMQSPQFKEILQKYMK